MMYDGHVLILFQVWLLTTRNTLSFNMFGPHVLHTSSYPAELGLDSTFQHITDGADQFCILEAEDDIDTWG